jgi:hypothetical protein
MTDQPPGRGPELPRHEPEIIPPGRDPRGARDTAGMWTYVNTRDGAQRIYIAQPGWPTIVFILLIVGLFAAIAFLVLAGLLLFWIPIVVGGILLALVSGVARYRWRQLQAWWSGR